MKYTICVTGKIGTGKSTVSNFFKEKGFKYINMDEIGKEVFYSKSKEIKALFGTDNRKEISKIVFTQKDMLKKLEQLLHPQMLKKLENLTQNNGLYVIEAAIKRRLKITCDLTITVTCSKDVIHKRLANRGLNKSMVDKILENQSDILDEGIIIRNDYSLELLNENLKKIFAILTKTLPC
ncbi:MULTISPECIES: dephospho-CoA kinase [unclassified Thermosipho (in: thermotogales)]|uniref:dephospho-CoA kinase n=1 Tax=unclassified Thermosipho (in: thermotogales) TaxID=2676525 RepID=UPI0009848E31|nr:MULTISPECIES: dephospho-CoA kinase [unclassified Thermosipho (in: thermotogales)]MBT1248402.1 dephospho-CoA kinase [Thermosipho sp. 1244]OOC47530.1 dephospho-CoA kinase [Thermosipho sp. 1223]